ncbi:SusC/RagA family TonB-linked outer membrane protein [Chitinophaga sedimenti]|uniref:SusC/RagA family TonB-linked outer membrane protein n=1 Tax=Chitinophaga sedimenti TaxID=2033606 RepID=UPI0020050037|nr:SusC/RagA family TonB-linked outer membrane protein [Chitinophaga sedimenti]MCK7553710.1 SusC/RagA family TonB-linked outer membrane protein [Chitinophaga sedimenti]
MKITAVLLLSVCLQVSARGYAQNVTFSGRNLPLEKLFRYFEKQTGYGFFYDHQLIDKAPKVSVDFKDVPLEKAMEEALRDQWLSYSIVGKNVVIRKKDIYMNLGPVKILVQDTTVEATGRVTDARNQPLPGATVADKATGKGAATDANGNFKLRVSRGAMLTISYLGFKSRDVQVVNAQPIEIKLEDQVNVTDEIVVVGYGTVRKSDLTGSLSQVKSKDITAFPSTNVMQALNGRAAGVRVMQNGGSPGGGVSIRVRGTNSILGGNEPLYVIDGFPYNGNPTFLQNADIASLEILKDASSTAIYGSRGANGVVMITTKSGRKNDFTSVDVDASYTLQTVSKKMPLMNAQQYALLYNEQAKNDGLAPYFTQNYIDSLGGVKGTDWQDLVLRQAPIYTVSATVNGGTQKTKFSIGSSAFLQEGIIRASDYKRYNLRANIEHDINKVFTVSFNSILTRLSSARQNSGLGNRGSDLISAMLMAPPSVTPYLPSGAYRRLNTAYPFISNAIINPLIFTNEQRDVIKSDRVFANAAVIVKPLDGLTLRFSGGIDNINDRTDQYSNIEPTVNSVGNASIATTQQTGMLSENTATYQKEIGIHSFTALAGFTYQDNVSTSLNGSGNGFLSDVLGTGNIRGSATPGIPSSGYSKWVLLSYLARLNYTLNDKYLFTASIRRDGSSRYSRNNQWENFPSAAVAWKASNEEFLKKSKVVSDLKVRATYGLSGNTSLNPYQTLNLLGSGNTIFGDALFVSYGPGVVLPGDLKWEVTRQLDFGAELGLFKNDLRLTFDYYRKRTVNLLNNVNLPRSMGYERTLKNVGEMENTGIELGLDAAILKGDVQWNMNGNIAFNRNKVVKLYDGQDIYGSAFTPVL